MNEMIEPKTIVGDILERFPETLPVFLKWKLDCFGCSLSSFCTLEDVANDYHLDLPELIAGLRQAVSE